MLILKCIDTIKNKSGKILYYRLMDEAGNTKDATKEMITNAILRGGITITNLRVGSDGRLYDPTKVHCNSKRNVCTKASTAIKRDVQYENIGTSVNDTFILSKDGLAIVIDKVGRTDKLEFHTNTSVWLEENRAKRAGASSIKIIRFENNTFVIKTDNISALCTGYGNIKIEEMHNAEEMFMGCKIPNIDFSILKGIKPVYMDKMFKQSKINANILDVLDTEEVVSMENMFDSYKPYNETICISGHRWNTSNLEYMNEMFRECTAKLISIHGIDLTKVLEMKGTFSKCKAVLDIKDVNTSRLVDTSRMFEQYESENLNIDWLDTGRVTNMQQMFFCCKTREIILHHLNLENVKSFREAFGSSITEEISVQKIGMAGIDYTMMFRKAVSKLVNIGIFRIAEDTMIDGILTDSKFSKLIINNLIINKDIDNTLIEKVFSKIKIDEIIIKRINATESQIVKLQEVLGNKAILRINTN